METKILTDEQLNLLKIYNIINSNEKLKQLAQTLDTKTDSTIQHTVEEILEKLIIKNSENSSEKKTRIYIDGVFDIIHSGHFNAIRQAKKLGDILVVGVNSDSDVEKAKGPTLMNVHERAALVSACKWVDEVVLDTPYSPTLELLDSLNIDYCAHGDDPCFNENGEDAYKQIKEAGRFKVFKRTEGISTTEILGRLILANRSYSMDTKEMMTSSDMLKKAQEETLEKGPVVSSFLSTGWRLHEFCNNVSPKDTDKIVYIDGAFDILHIGHIETLKKAKEQGDFLYVGVHDDATVNQHRGKNYPILNLQERVFNLLALKYVDDVVIGAPWKITEDILKSLRINLVVEGSNRKFDEDYDHLGLDPYSEAKRLGIYKEIPSTCDLTNEVLVQRVVKRREIYMKKYLSKSQKENDYYKQKEYISEI
jgi:ethanolamine-phosphate cytidylyltransferase